MAVRQRKLEQKHDQNNQYSFSTTTSSSRPKIQRQFFVIVFMVFIVILYFGYSTKTLHPLVDNFAQKFGKTPPVFAVVIDAGSTGSRVLAYRFHRGFLDGRLILDDELFKQSKPGLSSFADNPSKGAQTIENLLQLAKEVIPTSYYSKTPVMVRATAGLRLLKPEQAENILNSVREVINKSGFLVYDDAVEIMDGTDEGIMSWFTVNYLLGHLNGDTVAALDLGGGSNQVTFAPPLSHLEKGTYGSHLMTVPSFKGNITVFTHSYLGLGLKAARYAVFTKNNGDSKSLSSPCINPIIKSKPWVYGNIEYSISGTTLESNKLEVDWPKCRKLLADTLLPLVDPKPTGLEVQDIAAFSYFFDRTTGAGLIDPFLGGEVTVGEIEKTAKVVCKTANTDQPFMCFDLTFISVLLKDGFGLKPESNLKLLKKIDNHEISWALGCAYNMLNKQ
uniref:nucleoside diphosphate phosphatase n=1 Tax=Xenopsylla cheopis TaxID=163159 RepID=A0A6M2DF99_XENCH